jgi:hypothetical protein
MSASEEAEQKHQEELNTAAAKLREKIEPKKNEEVKKKSSCFSDMMNKLCRLCSKDNELKEMKAMLKDILWEMRKDGEKKKYEIDDVGATTARIEEAIREMRDEINKQGRSARYGRWNAVSFSLYAMGLALVSFMDKIYPGLAFIEGGIAISVLIFVDSITQSKRRKVDK